MRRIPTHAVPPPGVLGVGVRLVSPKWSVLMGLLVLGCQSELELPPIIETSEHLVLRGETDVCAGIFEAISLMSTS